MNFLEPLFLVGLLAAFLPILVHMINRKKAVRRVFGPMRFLLESHQRKASGFKAKQFLLMAIRVLLIALLALALAKPFFLSASGLSSSERLPSATAIVIDNSFSMDASWEKAQEHLEKELDTLRTWDQVVVITTNPENSDSEKRKLSDDKNKAKTYARSVKVSKEKGNIAHTIEEAARIIATSELPNRRIAVISDFAKGGFPTETMPNEKIDIPVDAYTSRSSTRENVAIVSISYEQEGDPRDRIWAIRASVKNFGKTEQKVKLELHIHTQIVGGTEISIPPNVVKTHVFKHMIEEKGSVEGFIKIQHEDAIEFDNKRFFNIHLHEKINVLIVNGEPNSVIYRDETFFLEKALNPMGTTESNIGITITTREGLETQPLKKYDVIVMANVSRVTPPAAKKLRTYVHDGGGLFLTMGDQVDTKAYNQHLSELLPKPLRGLKRLALRNDPDAPVKITHLGASDTRHPIFKVFELPGGTTLGNVEVYSYMLLEPSPVERSKTILSFKDNAPALLERKVGRGSVLLLTTSVDDEWTDLPFRTSFLPLVRRVSQHLAKRVNSSDRKKVFVGGKINLEIGSLIRDRLIVKSPTKKRFVFKPVDGVVEFEVQEPGVYHLWADEEEKENKLEQLDFAVNFDPEESDLSSVDPKTRDRWLESKSEEGKGEQVSNEKRVNIWPFLLFLVTIMLLLETIISTRQSVLTRLWQNVFFRDKT